MAKSNAPAAFLAPEQSVRQKDIHWNPSIVDLFVKAKSSTIEGFSTNEGFLCSKKSICQAQHVY